VACVVRLRLPLAVAPKRSCPKTEQHKTQLRPTGALSDCDEPRLCDDAGTRERREWRLLTCVCFLLGEIKGMAIAMFISCEGPFQGMACRYIYMVCIITLIHSHRRHHQIPPYMDRSKSHQQPALSSARDHSRTNGLWRIGSESRRRIIAHQPLLYFPIPEQGLVFAQNLAVRGPRASHCELSEPPRCGGDNRWRPSIGRGPSASATGRVYLRLADLGSANTDTGCPHGRKHVNDHDARWRLWLCELRS
jgi:hypothetical protein